MTPPVRNRSVAVHLAALVAVPIFAVPAFVVAISGFMFTQQLRGTLISCILIAVTVIPVAVVLGRRIAFRAMEEEQHRSTERAVEESRRQLVAWVSHDLRTGLGLAIARGLVRGHGGQFDARNVGLGCEFAVRLPLAQPGYQRAELTMPSLRSTLE